MHRLLSILLILCPLASAQQKPASPTPGQIDPHRICATKPDQTYALYLPSSYTPTKKWPIVYAFDPSARGDRPIDTLKAAAEKYGYIVAASNNSRNGPWPPEIEAAQAVSDDTHTTLVHRRSSRLLHWILRRFPRSRPYRPTLQMRRGRLPERRRIPCRHCALSERFRLSRYSPPLAMSISISPKSHALTKPSRPQAHPHFLRYFEGPHQWAPPEVAEEALAWFRLLAMKKDATPRDADFIAQQRDTEIARAKSFEQVRQSLLRVARIQPGDRNVRRTRRHRPIPRSRSISRARRKMSAKAASASNATSKNKRISSPT